MQIVSCPTCGDPLPEANGLCPRCSVTADLPEVTAHPEQGDTPGEMPVEAILEQADAIPPEQSETIPIGRFPPEPNEIAPTIKLARKATRTRSVRPQELIEAALTIKLARKATKAKREMEAEETGTDETLNLKQLLGADETLNLKQLRRRARADLEADILTPDNEELEEDQDDEIITGHGTWQKVVEHKTPPLLPAIIIPAPNSRPGSLVSALRPRWCSPRMFLWLNVLLICSLLLAGGFGIAVIYARHAAPAHIPTLQASPSLIALGGILTLRGTQFTPHSQIALSRDKHIPVIDTGNASSIQADAHGTFNDTVIVDPSWLSGLHMLYATDTRTRRQVKAAIMVVGQNALQGPPHLLLSANSLDLGSGDMATNGSNLLALSNAGGGQVTWQASTDQPWLQISPNSGIISSGHPQSAIVAADRSGLAPGTYRATILLTSNTAEISLPVTMQVIPLQPAHQAVLQLSPAVLAFTGSAQGPTPPAQTITMSNPGVQPLSWNSSVRMNVGYGWLLMSPQAGNIPPGGQQQITVSINTQNLLPTVYQGALVFSSQGSQPVQGSPQNIYVSMTVTPACTLTFGSPQLSFTGAHNQAPPAGQALNINVAQGCKASQTWHASISTTSGGNWLHINQSQATTPSSSLVSADTTRLGPGTYRGTLTFAVNTGPQIVPVTLNVNPLPCTVSGPGTLALQGTAGQSGSVSQAITINTGGDCLHSLNWTSSVSPGTSWLSATPAGSFTQPATASVNEQASLAGLSAGTYTGSVTITVVDSSTNTIVGTVQTSVTLTVLPACTLQAPSNSTLNFSAVSGANPATQTQTFTIGATGNCAGNVTITPSGNSAWLAVSGPATIASGGNATFTVTVNSSSLAINNYAGAITLTATDGNGTITSSPQTVNVSLNVLQPCTLQAPSATALNFTASANVSNSPQTQTFTIGATGNCAGNVTITPSTDSGSSSWLAASISGNNVTVTVTSNAQAAGTYTGTITLTAADGNGAITGIPQTVSVTLTVS